MCVNLILTEEDTAHELKYLMEARVPQISIEVYDDFYEANPGVSLDSLIEDYRYYIVERYRDGFIIAT